jgi:two-component system LytT family response regulator
MDKLRTLIVDDEELARKRMKRLLASFNSDFLITGEASNGDEAEKAIESLKPDIVFLDIQMPGKSIFKVLSELNHKPFIVFCTAYDSYALKAFETHAVDYLIKPIDEERLNFTVEKIKKIVTSPPNFVSFQKLVETLKKLEDKHVPTSIHHKVGDKTILVKLEKVVYLEAEDKYVSFYTVDATKYISDQSLKMLEEKLPDNFVRVSKSTIINKNYIKEIIRYFRGCVIFVLDDLKRTKIQSGRAFTEKIKGIFDL